MVVSLVGGVKESNHNTDNTQNNCDFQTQKGKYKQAKRKCLKADSDFLKTNLNCLTIGDLPRNSFS